MGLFGFGKKSADKTRDDFKRRAAYSLKCSLCGTDKDVSFSLSASGPGDTAYRPVCGKCYMRQLGYRRTGNGAKDGDWTQTTVRGNILHEKRLNGEYGKGGKK